MSKAFLLQVKYRTYLDNKPYVDEMPETIEKWEPSAVFHERSKACEYAYDSGITEYQVTEVDINPTRERRRA